MQAYINFNAKRVYIMGIPNVVAAGWMGFYFGWFNRELTGRGWRINWFDATTFFQPPRQSVGPISLGADAQTNVQTLSKAILAGPTPPTCSLDAHAPGCVECCEHCPCQGQ